MGYAPLSMGLSAGGGLLGAAGSIMGGNASAASDRYQAAVAIRNANTSAQQADVAQQQGMQAAQPYYQQGSQRMGAARAGLAASGVDVNSGSAVADQASIARTTAQNVNAVSYDADVRALGLRNQAADYQTQAGIDRAAAGQAQRAGLFGAATSLIGSASAVASKWDSFRNNLPPATPTIEGYDPTKVGTDGTQLAAAGGTNPWGFAMLPGR